MSVRGYNHTMKVAAMTVENVDKMIRENTIFMLREAKKQTPVATGHLKASAIAEFPGRFTGVVAYHADYAPYVEMGTRRMAGRPFLRPAFDATVRRIHMGVGMPKL